METDTSGLLAKLRSVFNSDAANTRLLSADGGIDIDKLLVFLGDNLMKSAFTLRIGETFTDILPLIVSKRFAFNSEDEISMHQRNCIVLSKLLPYSCDIQRFSLTYFNKKPSPFELEEMPARKRKMTKVNANERPTPLEIVECCYTFLKFDTNYFKRSWQWSQFIQSYCIYDKLDHSTAEYQLICNHIMALLTNMTIKQVQQLNKNIPINLQIDFDIKYNITGAKSISSADNKDNIKSDVGSQKFESDALTNVEGVLLPIFDATNSVVFNKFNDTNQIVMVDSAQSNLRSISIGIVAGKAICLSGPVGCGKTTLVEYLAHRTGRIPPKFIDGDRHDSRNSKSIESPDTNGSDGSKPQISKKSQKRKATGADEQSNGVDDELAKLLERKSPPNGFLRIQLGDQTDSKMLLGQYRCTDVPGEFVWQAGVLTQAVINGYWLLLEDLDSCTQDVCMLLSNLLENNFLTVPGFRDCIQISSGFQLFVTLRTNKNAQSSGTYFQLLDKYLYTINVLPLSRSELCQIVCTKYPKLATVSDRIVDVFLTFSSGCHALEAEISDTDDSNEAIKNNLRHVRSSNRLVSTRDLLKLCSRSSPTFSITSQECAYFVFQNAVDLLCSHLVQSEMKNELIVSIGAKLGIIPSRCQYLSNEHKPEIAVGASRTIRIGRVELLRRLEHIENTETLLKRGSDETIDDCAGQKRLKIDKSSHLNMLQQTKRKIPSFSFTRLASCLLERVSVAVNENEPVLLVGETGVGKTSSVQYLAYQTNHKLVVINMNNQSDVSDLIGGFKPVDLAFVIAPLRSEFEFLFKQTFNVQKNEKFLNNVSVCYNQANYHVLIRLMTKIVETVFGRKADNSSGTQKSERILERWNTLKIKLLKLDVQLKQSINISFAFITGPLVNCIKNGDWVLLDEINLASTETLECLSTILEPNGSIVLLEKGDFVPIKRHPDFRIFACMNPSTDIGKKDLATGIRNRFSEFFVDELTSENDLIILVGDYLKNTGIQSTKVLAIVKLYQKLRAMAQLELSDGLGNQPVYSLRTLCRALMICAKNLCGSVERNLYESFCLSFLTQLDPASHLLVLDLIQKSLISNKKAILSQALPKLDGDFIDFEGYWIQNGPKDVQACENYILTPSVQANLKDLARVISIGKLPVLLQGPTSAGKTSLIDYVAKRSGNYCLRINNHEHTDLQEYIGTYTADVTGKLTFKQGVLVQAMKNGYWIILDELNLAPSDILEALNRVLDDNRELFIPETQELIRAHPNFMLFATQNPPGLYGGRKTLSRAFKNRFIELHFAEIPKPELEIILEKRCLIPKSYATKMVKTMSELQVNRKNAAKSSFTLRDLFRWGNRYTYANTELNQDSRYDWNQHLVDEGYLVLSSKIRNENEVEIIQTALFNHFRKKIVVDNLFMLHENTSMVTKGLLKKIADHPHYNNIVWTINIRRMAVLTGKASEFNEPVLLVGPTGCGKTTICQILADIAATQLRILNCHMHTEGADFLGGLRPYRGDRNAKDENQQLFEWNDGPLIESMIEGSFFLADEISLAEDSVLERLNCVLESERTILLAEKGGCNDNFLSDLTNQTKIGEFVITANDGFQFMATMNPGGDFGKKELSPALRNRFTEIWCRPADNESDLVRIAEHSLKIGFKVENQSNVDALVNDIATIIIKTVFHIKHTIDKFNYSIRDVLAWVQFITTNASVTDKSKQLSVHEALAFGIETIFLDSLEMLPHNDFDEIQQQRATILKFMFQEIRKRLQKTLNPEELQQRKQTPIVDEMNRFGIAPFFVEVSANRVLHQTDFKFTAPTTKNNLFRLLSAMSLHKAILLEGPPGVGKTSLIENVAASIGYEMVRINLCEHTDLADLFGTDQPSDDNSLTTNNGSETPTLGSFVWRDGPLLAALKAPNTWILLDELNLAPQSVLEGLNAILDHRGEVYIPELNKTFKIDQQTRIFASQNPLRQGGGRKGLPQSFLNRFTKVYLSKLNTGDLCHVIDTKYATFFNKLKSYLIPVTPMECDHSQSYFECHEEGTDFDCCQRMVTFSERLDTSISNLEFGYKGGPYEVNLRDILRWCDFLLNPQSGFSLANNNSTIAKRYSEFMLCLYEKMKLVYCQRMRTDLDKVFIQNVFGEVFSCDVADLERRSQSISLYWNDEYVYFNDIRINIKSSGDESDGSAMVRTKKSVPLMLSTQRESLKALAECVIMEMPAILCGPTDSGKTKLIDTLCTLSNRYVGLDTIDDSVTGSFQQIDLNRHLEEIAQAIESILTRYLQDSVSRKSLSNQFLDILQSWESFVSLSHNHNVFAVESAMSEELIHFNKRLLTLKYTLKLLPGLTEKTVLIELTNKLEVLESIIKNRKTLNTGGHFEWVDSKIVRALKCGQFICLEHVNLCSSAILDRLNSVFETNGRLLLSEKGVLSNNQTEIVSKHSDFRAFLTLDPRNGEISRAMRNRCVEINLASDSYTVDDLKCLIYENGIQCMHLIDWTLRVHSRVQQISEFHAFNVSHLCKYAFLIQQNIRLGRDEKSALFDSAMEVYVRSSHIDLLGFGLAYYRNKLCDEIKDEISKLTNDFVDVVDFGAVVVHASELNSLSLVRLQSEPLLTALKCLQHGMDSAEIQKVFTSLRAKCTEIDGVFDWNTCKYLLYILYEISSVSDVNMREHFVNKMISSLNGASESVQFAELLKWNNELSTVVSRLEKFSLPSIPWNQHIFRRLRDDNKHTLTTSDQLKLSAILLAQIVFKPIDVDNKFKQSHINAITYSMATNAKIIPNVLDKDLITYLHPFLEHIKLFAVETVWQANSINYDTYVQIIFAYFWTNRLYEVAREKVFVDKILNPTLVDKLTLHINWLNKYMLNCLNDIHITNGHHAKEFTQFRQAIKKLSDFIRDHRHPLNEMRKQFTKKLTNFAPFFEQAQVDLHDSVTQFRKQTQLIAQNIQLASGDEIQKKLRILMSEECVQYKNVLLEQLNGNNLDWFIERSELNAAAPTADQNILAILNGLSSVCSSEPAMSALDQQKQIFADFRKTIDELTITTETATFKLVTSLLPLLEYFAVKSLNTIQTRASRHFALNAEYFKNIRSLDIDALHLVHTISTENFKVLESVWDIIQTKFNGEIDLKSILAELPDGLYKKLSSNMRSLNARTFRIAQHSLAYNQTIANANTAIDIPKYEQLSANSCLLTSTAFLALFDESGQLKATGLGDLDHWRNTLTSISKLLWNNIELFRKDFNFEHSNIEHSQLYGRRLLTEVQYIESIVGVQAHGPQFIDEFQKVIGHLTENLTIDSECVPAAAVPEGRYKNFYQSSIVNALVAVLELHLLTFMPLVDPVEKNRLKRVYTEEDLLHLNNMKSAYKMMQIIMNYDHLGEEIVNLLNNKQQQLEELLGKYSKKCALRPEICSYAELVSQCSFFLDNGCRPKAQLQLINDIDAAFKHLNNDNNLTQQDINNVTEVIKRVEWCINTADSFEQSTILRFSAYYQDFTSPLLSSISMLKHSFHGLRQCLIKARDSIVLQAGELRQFNEDEVISNVLSNLIHFPTVSSLSNQVDSSNETNLSTVLDKLENKDSAQFILMKTKLQEINCNLMVAQTIDKQSFEQFELAFQYFNDLWKRQEETRRRKAAEEESLYVNKTRCVTENEDEVIDREIETIFPNYAESDFAEFIQNATLEQVKVKPVQTTKTHQDILNEKDLGFLGDQFIEIMCNYSRFDYYKSTNTELNPLQYHSTVINSYEMKSKIFYQLVQKYKTILSSSVDEAFYAGLGLLVGLIQSKHHLIATNDDIRTSNPYNFYKDSNIPEIQHTTTLLNKLEARVLAEQQNWPDHAVLNDIILIIARIRSLPSTSPIARFSTGFQILRQKVDEWNSVAHKLNHLREIEIEIAEYVQRWTRLELQCWRECLTQTHDKIRSKAYRYWFFMFNLITEYLNGTVSSLPCDITDFKSVEKCFDNEGTDDVNGESDRTRLRTIEVISVVKQFIESSNFGEFSLRMDILRSFEYYVQHTQVGVKSKREALAAILHNLHMYYTQFSAEIAEAITSKRTPIEKKLKQFVKIESYNKDLSYYSMKNNVARVHRHLHKFLREFEEVLMEKIATVFVWRANDTHALVDEATNSKKAQYEPNIVDYMVDVKVFMAPQKLRDIYVIEASDSSESSSLLGRIEKLFKTSRNIVERAILHTSFPTLVYKLDVMVAGQIENCNYLRKLEVDRSQEKPKQKSQAKHILQQKRKALADSFKQLTTLGLSYRSGLLEGTLQKNMVDLKILPFDFYTLLDRTNTNKKIRQKVSDPNVNLNLSYVKCIFKLKLLQTVMLTPSPELGMQNLERIKGYATDLFLLAQQQRQSLSKASVELQGLHKNIESINQLLEIVTNEGSDFDLYAAPQRLARIDRILGQIIEVAEQYDLLLNFVVGDEDELYKTVLSSNVSAFTQNSGKYKQFRASLASVANNTKSLQRSMIPKRNREFQTTAECVRVKTSFNEIRSEIHETRNILLFSSDEEEHMIIAKPLTDLLAAIDSELDNTESCNELQSISEANHSCENINNELENIVHLILISMQSIYKKYAVKTEITYDATNGTIEENARDESKPSTEITPCAEDEDDDGDDEIEEEIIEENHLKEKIVEAISADLKTLGLSAILTKLVKIITVIRVTGDETQKLSLKKCIGQLVSITPILEQFNLLCQYYLVQQIDSHRVTVRMLGVMLTVFIELCAKGFCIPPDLMQDEDGEQSGEQNEGKEGEGFGLEDGTGEKDVSDKIESEDQLDTAKKPGDNDENDKEDADCKEEKGIDMSEDFDSKLQDVEKNKDDSSDEEEPDNEEELDKQMGETEDGADKLDEQIWGSEDEDENEDEEEDINDEDENEGKGAKEDDEKHNDLDSNDQKETEGDEQDGLDAANDDNKQKKQKEKDIDNLNEQDDGEEQSNPYHNELEDPQEPEEMDLDDLNLDKGEPNNDNEERDEENPFDIDKMKEQMEHDGEENEEDGEEENDKEDKAADNGDESNSDFDDDDDVNLKKDETENEQNEENETNEENAEEPEIQTPGLDEDEKNEDATEDEPKENERKEDKTDFHESKDKQSNEQNVQAMPDMKDKGSSDQVQNEKNADENKQENQMDAQDTGEDKDGTGQADNEESEAGHQGVANTKNTSNTKQSKQKEKKEQRKPGEANEERTVSQNRAEEKKQLKTIQEMNDNSNVDDKENDEKENAEADEYQHVKDAKQTDKTTMDNATEDQSKKIAHDENEQDIDQEMENNDELAEEEDDIDEKPELTDVQDELKGELNANEPNKDKLSKGDRQKEACEAKEEGDIEGDIQETYLVPRSDDTTAHCAMDIVQDASTATDLTNVEMLDMRKMYENERATNKFIHPAQKDFEEWQKISNRMLPNARELCEQLRLILEPTKCTRLRGDYRTGRRINMKKIIPYIASQFRKDKIWLRRTKPAQRDYKISIAIDDSKSMDYNNSKELTLQAIALVSQALTLLESGRLSILSFGESPQIILNHSDQFDGPKLVKSLNFDQNQSRIAELLEFTRISCSDDAGGSSDNGIFENLLLVLSDGRNIFSEGEKKVRNAIKLARQQRIFIVYIIIDNPDNKHSILDIRVPHFTADLKTITMKSYLDTFPFPYYVIVRDLAQLPLVLSDAMRQWFELVSSEQ